MAPIIEELNSLNLEQETSLYTDMDAQSREFYKRYSNVKQRNESSDKVISEMKK